MLYLAQMQQPQRLENENALGGSKLAENDLRRLEIIENKLRRLENPAAHGPRRCETTPRSTQWSFKLREAKL